LEKGEEHTRGWLNRNHDVIAQRIGRTFKVLGEFQPRIDH
jgi:hypothetical protein